MSNDRGLSNTLGFILLFAVILVSIGAVSTFGLDTLQDARDGTVQQNADAAMENVGEQVTSLRRDNTTLRSTLLRTGGGTVRADTQQRRIQINYGDNNTVELDRQFRPLTYSYRGTELYYEAGAVIRVEGDGSFPVEAPAISESSDTLILPVVTTSASAPDSSISGGTVSMYLQKIDSEKLGHSTSTESVRMILETTPERAEAWRAMVDRSQLNPDSCTGSGGTVNCVWTKDNLIVRHVHVQYQIVG